MKTTPWTIVAAALVLVVWSTNNLCGDELDDHNGEAKELLPQARRVKAESQDEESEKFVRETKQRKANAQKSTETRTERPAELATREKELDQLRARLKELEAMDRGDDPAEVKREMQKLEQAIEKRERALLRDRRRDAADRDDTWD